MLLVGAGLRIYSALTKAIEIDELFTRDVISGSVRAGAAMVLGDRYHPPLHYAVAKILSPLSGTSPEGLRLVSVLSGIALVACVAFLARALLADVSLALLAALLVALSDWQILVSHYARSYSLFDLLVLLASAALWKACQDPLELKFWVAYVVAGGAIVNTNYVGWLYVVSVFPVVALCGARVLRRWLLACSAIVVLFLPWLLLLTWYARGKDSFASKLAALGNKQTTGALANALAQLNGLPTQTSWAILVTLVVGGLFVALAVAGACRRWRVAGPDPGSVGVLIMASLAVLPPFVLWLVSGPPLDVPIWGVRQLTPSIAPWILAACAGGSATRGRFVLRAAMAATLVVLQGTATVTNTVHGRFVPFHKMARLFATRPAASSTVYTLCESLCGPLLRHYLPPSGSLEPLSDTDPALPKSFWLVYQPADVAQQARIHGLLGRGWSVFVFQDFEKRAGLRGSVRAALLARQKAAAEDPTTGGYS